MLLALLVPDEVELARGTVIEASTKVKPAVYNLPSASETGQVAAITVRGEGITVDFQGATLEGTPQTAEPDERRGYGLRIDGKDVTIKNARIRGYKVGIVAWNVPGLKLIDCDVSHNWKQRLRSDLEREDAADWMSYHKNEAHEWLRYGAGAYLSGCDGFEVKGLRATGGQCGLMVDKCNEGTVWNCDIRFMSGVGLGLYRSSGNKVFHNRLDWCVRGYSHGVYNRGQDSTGILVYEQSSNNVFAYNSATHGGDGFFLWAGQTTMDTGEGGCNDNVLYGNDFSHSPANGIEATFSRNVFVRNKLLDCWHGVWGGYSFDTLIAANEFGFNAESVAIEHGQFNRIEGNVFRRDANSVMLWQGEGAPDPNWGYPKFRDTRNIGTLVGHNRFIDVADVALELGTGDRLSILGNTVEQAANSLRLRGALSRSTIAGNKFDGEPPASRPAWLDAEQFHPTGRQPSPPLMNRGGGQIVANEESGSRYVRQFEGWDPWPGSPTLPAGLVAPLSALDSVAKLVEKHAQPRMAGGIDPFLPSGTLRGRKYILVDEWGPYDFRRPILWPRGEGRFEVLGPPGKWRLESTSGCRLSADFGTVPGEVTVLAQHGPWEAHLVYVGEETVDHRGVVTAAGQPVPFGAKNDRVAVQWDVRWFVWDPAASDPRKQPEAFEAALQGTPVASQSVGRLDFATSGSPAAGVPSDHFATIAEGEFDWRGGAAQLEVTTDDGVRVWVDGELVIDEWKYQGPTRYAKTLSLAPGRRKIRVQHFEIDGYTALQVGIRPEGKRK
jgi:hypothetical protein